MQKLLTVLGDLIFPPSSEIKLLREVETLKLNTLYKPGIYQNFIYLCQYSEPIIKAAIIENKFHNNKLAAQHLGTILGKWASQKKRPVTFVPIPLGNKRLRQRGYNQVENILRASPSRTHTTSNLLKRKIETLPQSQLNKTKRKQNMKNVFQYAGKKENFLVDTLFVIVDDVVTTGETLKAARATLAPHLPPNATLICLALAH